MQGTHQPGGAAAAVIVALVVGVTTGAASAQGFMETFDGVGYTPGQALPDPPWSAGGAQNQSADVSSFGWMGTQASHKPVTSAWGDSARAFGVGTGPVEMRAKIHVDPADYGNLTRLGWAIEDGPFSSNARIGNEFAGDVGGGVQGAVNWRVRGPGGVAQSGNWAVTANTWYESRTVAAPLGGGNWRVNMDHRQWTGSAWGSWQSDLTNYDWNEPAFTPSHSRLAHIGTASNTVLDDFGITAQGYGRPVSVDAPQLFIDGNRFTAVNATQQFHSAQKHQSNPVIYAEHPWERANGGPAASIIYDEDEGIFKAWYQGVIGTTAGSDDYGPHTLNYATSTDGINWTKPNLGLHLVEGTMNNNVVVPPTYHDGKDHWESVRKDPLETDPTKRYKAIGWSSYDPDGGAWCSGSTCGIYTMTSPDGLNWTHTADPVFYYHPPAGELGPVGDSQTLLIDTANGRYVAMLRSLPNRVYSVSTDFENWTAPTNIALQAEAGETSNTVYNHVGFNYGDEYLGFLTYFHRDTGLALHPDLDVRLLYSQDGLHYERPGPDPNQRVPLIGTGDSGEWDRYITMLTGAPPIRVGDELFIYYRGMSKVHGPFTAPDNYQDGGVGLATIRVDGFASLVAVGHGVVTTQPIIFDDGVVLRINADASSGEIRIALLDEFGVPLTGYELADAMSINTDSVDHLAAWAGGSDISALIGQPIQILFDMTDAELFSYTISSIIPEPSTLALLGAAGLMLLRRRRHAGLFRGSEN